MDKLQELKKKVGQLVIQAKTEKSHFYTADVLAEVHDLLSKAQEVRSYGRRRMWRTLSYEPDSFSDGYDMDEETHRAFLIGITEIKQETAEDVLRDLEEAIRLDLLDPLLERAKAILERGEK